jgi:glycosyltransferase involved in cell wall biosynthesis
MPAPLNTPCVDPLRAEPALVSVVIPAYNAARYLAEAIDSALAQSHAAVEVIVVDDGSTDETPAVAASYGQRIRFLRQANAGPARARNFGASAACGAYLAFLDADDYWMPEKLTRQLACLRAHPEAALVHTPVFELDDTTGARELRIEPLEEFHGECYERLFLGNHITLSTVLVRRTCFEAVGGFDETIRTASVEDYDLWLRLARRFPLAHLDVPLVVYRRHAANASRQAWHIYKGDLMLVERALADRATAQNKLTSRVISKRLTDLHFGLGYHSLDECRYRDARRHFWRAAVTGGPSWRALLLCAACALPPPVVTSLRRVWSRNRRWHSAGAS